MAGAGRLPSACLAVWLAAGGLASAQEGAPDQLSARIRALSAGSADLMALYEPSDYGPLWLDSSFAPTDQSRDALRLLQHAGDDGLEPSDYGWPDLRARVAATAAVDTAPEERAAADVALSRALLGYLRDLRNGRVDPRTLGYDLSAAGDATDVISPLGDALRRGDLVATARSLAPRDPQYRALAVHLARYRTLVGQEWPPLPVPAQSVHPGDSYDGLAVLGERLAVLGDLPDGSSQSSRTEYGGDLVEAVRRFQRRHGLDADGVLGRLTLAALAVPPEVRVRQIELAMERARWLSRSQGGRLIVVNIPMFRLAAWDQVSSRGVARFTSDVVVGRAAKTQTPVLEAQLTDVVFRPPWNVPLSIARKEILPAIRREPSYLQRHDMELVTGYGDAEHVVPPTADNVAQLRSGAVRVRQRPGPQNSLGLIRFSFPNAHNVYMHATPVQGLWGKSRRDFSHGCVRVKDPVGLASWVLGGSSEGDRTRIETAMQANDSSRVPVRDSIRVVLFYTTAEVALDSGVMLFADDIYGEDARLDAALRAR